MLAALRRCLAVAFASLLVAAPAWSQGKIDLAVFHPEKNFWTPTLMWWIGEVDKATQGRVKFTPHFAGALVPLNETMKAVRDGSVPAGPTTGTGGGEERSTAIICSFGTAQNLYEVFSS